LALPLRIYLRSFTVSHVRPFAGSLAAQKFSQLLAAGSKLYGEAEDPWPLRDST